MGQTLMNCLMKSEHCLPESDPVVNCLPDQLVHTNKSLAHLPVVNKMCPRPVVCSITCKEGDSAKHVHHAMWSNDS